MKLGVSRAPRQGGTPRWVPRDRGLVTGVCALLALAIALPHLFGISPMPDAEPLYLYPKLFLHFARADVRTRHFFPMKAAGALHRLDEILRPDAKVFASGMVGSSKGTNLGFLYFTTYYLFPRQIDVSIGQSPRFTVGGWVEGVDCDSEEQLRAQGYDVHLRFRGGTLANDWIEFTLLSGPAAFRQP